MTVVSGSASLIPPGSSLGNREGATTLTPVRGGEAEPDTTSAELTAAIAHAQWLWALKHAPHLLKLWAND